MKTLTRCCVRATILAFVFVAPSTMPATAQRGEVTVGAAVYAADALCLDTNATFSNADARIAWDRLAVLVGWSNGAHPWTDPPTGGALAYRGVPNLNRGARPRALQSQAAQEGAFLTHGDAVRVMAETFPIAFLARLLNQREGTLGDINRYLRPFIGAGVYISGDGTVAPTGTNGRDLPTYGLEGSTSLILSYGARAYLPGRDAPISLVVLYRGNTMFLSDVVYRTPDNRTLRGDGETLTWGEWGLGVSVRIGG